MARLIENLKRMPRGLFRMAALVIVGAVGVADYLTGVEITFSAFYLMAVAVAVWFVGTRFGVMVSMLSVAAWLAGDLAAGARYGHAFVPVWNAVITLTFYLVTVWLLTSLRSLHNELEARVLQRTNALTEEMAERERLENEILNIGERERQRIGDDLHDSVGQHLTATAMAGQVLREKLAAQSSSEVPAANLLVQLVEQAIELIHQLARGLTLVDMTGEGLMDSLRELAASTEQRFNIPCRFVCSGQVLIHDSSTAIHLYRIAQEAVNNAIKHGKAASIIIRFSSDNGVATLTVQDDGIGLPEPLPKANGLGLHLMSHRSAMIGASFMAQRREGGGTVILCTLRGKL